MSSSRSGPAAPLALLFGLALSCAARRGPVLTLPPCAEGASDRDAEEALLSCLARGDALYAERQDRKRLDGALAIYTEATAIAPNDPRLLARLARANVARAYGDPESSAEGYRLAREQGLRCLATAPDVQGAISAAGGVLTTRAVGTVGRDLADCLLWTAMAWARGEQEGRLPGALLDQRLIVALAERAHTLAPALEGGSAAAALGIALALPPRPLNPDLEGAARMLLEAARRSPGRLSPRVDLAELVFARRGEIELWRTTLEEVAAKDIEPEDPDALENRRAVMRAQELLARGAPDPDAWWR